jgi:hypothetical protein
MSRFTEDPNAPEPHGRDGLIHGVHGIRLASRDDELCPNGTVFFRWEDEATAWTPEQRQSVERGILTAERYANS